LAKQTALASIERLKKTSFIEYFDGQNAGQPTYVETLKALDIEPTAPWYGSIENDSFDG